MDTSDISEDLLGISAVERDTGLLKETLRVWERRYGFPQPLRDALGERVYPKDQVERLRQFRRLMDRGWRPGKLMALSNAELQHALEGSSPQGDKTTPFPGLVDALHARDASSVHRLLASLLKRHGLKKFIVDVAVPMCVEVGNGWAGGELDVAQEHLFTEQLHNILRDTITTASRKPGYPRVLLTTFPDEYHTLGLLFAESLLAQKGAHCTSLGARTPLTDISRTMREGAFDILALSFSTSFPVRQAFSGLKELAGRLPADATIWAGSALLAARPQAIPGVQYLACIDDTLEALAAWCAARTGLAAAAPE